MQQEDSLVRNVSNEVNPVGTSRIPTEVGLLAVININFFIDCHR